MSELEAVQPEMEGERLKLKQGLTTSQIKWIALFFMTLDHLAAFGFEIPAIARHYDWLRLAGRIAAPLFLFALVQGLRYTRSKPKYLLRLYLAGMGTGLFVTVTNLLLGDIVGIVTPGNIIFTFFYVALYVWAIERLIQAVRDRNLRAALPPVLCCVVPLFTQPLYLALLALTPAGSGITISILIHDLLDSFLPTLVSVDYGWGMILLGIFLYFAGTKRKQCAVFGGFCLLCAVGSVLPVYHISGFMSGFVLTFIDTHQIWMALALPFMLLYNGQRGNAPKWFFYCYYPVHRYLISVAAAIAQGAL